MAARDESGTKNYSRPYPNGRCAMERKIVRTERLDTKQTRPMQQHCPKTPRTNARQPCSGGVWHGLSAMRYGKLRRALVPAAALALISLDAGAQGLTAHQLYGCWRLEAPRTKDALQRTAFVDLCFRADGTVYQAAIAPEGGGDDVFQWTLPNQDELVINRQTCGAHIGQHHNQQVLHLNTCVFMGGWFRQCSVLSSDGTGCAR
jgi:hypothetical protein